MELSIAPGKKKCKCGDFANFFGPIVNLPAPLSFGYYHMWILQLGLGRYQTTSR
jgi:hypothetical protein